MALKSTVVVLTIACIALTPWSCLAQHRQPRTQAQDRRETQKKNHPEPCDRLETKFTEKEKRWFIDFNCPVG